MQRFAVRSTNGGVRARRARGSANLAACKTLAINSFDRRPKSSEDHPTRHATDRKTAGPDVQSKASEDGRVRRASRPARLCLALPDWSPGCRRRHDACREICAARGAPLYSWPRPTSERGTQHHFVPWSRRPPLAAAETRRRRSTRPSHRRSTRGRDGTVREPRPPTHPSIAAEASSRSWPPPRSVP